MASDVLSNAGNEIRENLVTTAVKFLQNPNVQRCTMESKQRFLRGKGLTDPEIQKAIEKCIDMLDVPSMTSELMVFQSRRHWFRDHIVPVLVYGGFAYGCYWFYKNCIRNLLFVEEPRRKSTAECVEELRRSVEALSGAVGALRADLSAQHQHSTTRAHLDTIKADIASVKAILLNRNQFPALKGRGSCGEAGIPAWQRREGELGNAGGGGAGGDSPPAGPRPARSSSGGSNSSEGERATKNSDSSLEIIT